MSAIENWVYEVYLFYVQDKFASKNGWDKFSGSAGGAGTAGETTSQRWGSEKKKQKRRVDGVQLTLFNPIPEKFGELKIIHLLKDMFKHFEDMQINSIIPETDNLEFVNYYFLDHTDLQKETFLTEIQLYLFWFIKHTLQRTWLT